MRCIKAFRPNERKTLDRMDIEARSQQPGLEAVHVNARRVPKGGRSYVLISRDI